MFCSLCRGGFTDRESALCLISMLKVWSSGKGRGWSHSGDLVKLLTLLMLIQGLLLFPMQLNDWVTGYLLGINLLIHLLIYSTGKRGLGVKMFFCFFLSSHKGYQIGFVFCLSVIIDDYLLSDIQFFS